MKILLPFKKDLNPYLDEILKFTRHKFTYAHYSEYDPSYDIVNIHWPEAIFEWVEPSIEQLEELENNLLVWKRKSAIVYTKHDYQRNKGTTVNFTALFMLVEQYADVFIHLGNHSKDIYSRKFPLAKHEIVYHPVFTNSLKVFSKRKARDLLGINRDALVIMAPGNIRSFKERKLVLKSFGSLNIKNKVLIASNMRTELQYDFPGRVRMKKFVDFHKFFVSRFKNKHLPPKYIFNYSSISSVELSLRVSAADIVLVPRLNILNSGIVFLGLTFGKVIVGPSIGNIEEQLKELNFPLFNPQSISSVVKALEKGIEISRYGNYKKEPLEKYLPVNVAQEYDRVLSTHRKS